MGEGTLPPSPKLNQYHSQEQQDVINYAWEISNGDIRFIYLLAAENGQFTYKRVHPNHANTIGTDYGLCGVNDFYHRDLVSDPRFQSDWEWQLEQCYQLYENNVTFYGIIRYDSDPVYRSKIHAKFQ